MIKSFLQRAGQRLKQLAGANKKTKTAKERHSQADQAPKKPAARRKAGRTPDADPGGRNRNRQQERGDSGSRKGKYRRPRPGKRKKPRWTPAAFPVDPMPGKSRFHDFKLPRGIMHAIADLDFRYCTPIQEKALPAALAGKDLIGRAGTGTGKSAVFLIALFTRLLREKQEGKTKRRPGRPRALIIAPTRELVMQIAKDGKALGKYSHLRILAVYGGADYSKQQRQLSGRPVDVVAATPGRLLDFAAKGIINLKQASIMVIDEADRMLDMGFIPDVRRIIYKTPPKENRQTMLFSATVTEEVRRLASQWCIKPVYIESEPEQVAVDTVRQIVYMTTTAEKFTVLYNLITSKPHERILVFTNMKNEAGRLSERLKRHGIDSILLTGDVPQQKRMARLERFRAGATAVMVATDVAGRGIHIEGISHVVNFTLPYEPEDYVHRIGRTGRAGESGTSISFACEEGAFYLPEIEEYIGKPLSYTVPEEELMKKPPRPAAKQRHR